MLFANETKNEAQRLLMSAGGPDSFQDDLFVLAEPFTGVLQACRDLPDSVEDDRFIVAGRLASVLQAPSVPVTAAA